MKGTGLGEPVARPHNRRNFPVNGESHNHTIPKPPITIGSEVMRSIAENFVAMQPNSISLTPAIIPHLRRTYNFRSKTPAKYHLTILFAAFHLIVSQSIPQNLSPRDTHSPTKRFLPSSRCPSPLHAHAPIPTLCATIARASLRAYRTRPSPSHKGLQFPDPSPQPLILSLRFFHLLSMQSHVFVSRG